MSTIENLPKILAKNPEDSNEVAMLKKEYRELDRLEEEHKDHIASIRKRKEQIGKRIFDTNANGHP